MVSLACFAVSVVQAHVALSAAMVETGAGGGAGGVTGNDIGGGKRWSSRARWLRAFYQRHILYQQLLQEVLPITCRRFAQSLSAKPWKSLIAFS